jgi:hypothetical protein
MDEVEAPEERQVVEDVENVGLDELDAGGVVSSPVLVDPDDVIPGPPVSLTGTEPPAVQVQAPGTATSTRHSAYPAHTRPRNRRQHAE